MGAESNGSGSELAAPLGRRWIAPEYLRSGRLSSLSPRSSLRRRIASMSLVAGGSVSVFLVLYLIFLAESRLTIVLSCGLIAVYGAAVLVCRSSRVSDRIAADVSLGLWVLGAWGISVIHHFGHDGRIDMFTAALFPVFCLPLFADVGRWRITPTIVLMALSQPVVAVMAHVLRPATGSVRDVVFSCIGAAIVAMLAWAGTRLVQTARMTPAAFASADADGEIGGYLLGRRIGSGGMGEVWEGRHRLLARRVAIKIFTPPPRLQAGVTSRFEREAQATALLTSEHTVRLFDFGQAADGRLYYVMELLDGLDLQRVVERRGPLSPAHVVSVIAQSCESLGEAHANGLVHRDVKPSNLFLARIGLRTDFVKVLDFGLVSADAISTLTQAGVANFLGTVAYASPESLRGERQRPQSDVYQLGCVMFFLLTGRAVFERPSSVAIALAHSVEVPPLVSALAPEPIPEDLEALVARCLSKAPGDRPASAIELGEELRQLESYGRWSRAEGRAYFTSMVPGAPSNGVAAHFS